MNLGGIQCFLKNKIKKKVVATFILFEEYILKGLNFRKYLKVSKIGSRRNTIHKIKSRGGCFRRTELWALKRRR